MSTILPFANNTLATFVYEPFTYTISNPPPGSYTLTTSNVSSGIPPGYLSSNASEVAFTTSSNGMGIGTEYFTVVASQGGTVVATSSNTVTIGPGRFLDSQPSGAPYGVGTTFAFYKNEPITPIPLAAPFAISTPTAVPSLPPGLVYTSNASNSYSITGTPLVTVPQSNYLFIGRATGSNLGKIVTTKFNLMVGDERVNLNLSGSPIVSFMTVGTAITPRVITAQFPPYPSGGTLRYTWPGLPDGLVVTDNLGNIQTPPTFTPIDASSTLIISGTPTIAAANAFRDDLISSTTVNFTATRTNPLPQISNNQAITFSFDETVLFDTPSVPSLYSGVTIDPGTVFFRAQTYFGSGSAISNIFSPDLRSDLSLSFIPLLGRANLLGTPIGTGSANYTIRAINSNGFTRDISVPINVVADSVSFISPPTPAVDICYNFILSRPSSLSLSGYYTTNIQFQATAASGKPVNFSTLGLAGTGLSISNVSANVIQIVGIPDTITPLSTVTITADASGTPATASRTFKLAVLNDVITISDVAASLLAFVQNRAITPVQLSATSLSERPVISFTSTNLPAGLSLSTSGLLTGAPTAFTTSPDTFTVTASTGYASQSKVYTYNTVADNLVIVIPTTTITVPTTFSGAEFDILTYSGGEGEFGVVPVAPGIQPTQSTMATVTPVLPNLLSGNFTNVPVLAPEYRFIAQGVVGSFSANKQINVTVTGGPTIQHSALYASNIIYPTPMTSPYPIPTVSGRIETSIDAPVTFTNPNTITPAVTGPASWTVRTTFDAVEGTGFDMARNSNVFVAVLGSNIIRSEDYGNTWSNVSSSNIQTAAGVSGLQYSGDKDPLFLSPPRLRLSNATFGAIATDGTSNWWAIGVGTVDGPIWDPISIVRKSTDNGQTWTDISLALSGSISPFIMQSNKLTYNQGRLFYTGRQSVGAESDAFYYADVTDITTWTNPIKTLGTAGSIIGLAASNSTLFAAGDDSNGTATFVSTDNGTTWSDGTNPNPGPGSIVSNYRYADVYQKYGYWFLGGQSNGEEFLHSSSNLTVWQQRTDPGIPGEYSVTTENGITWTSGGIVASGRTTQWESDGTLVSGTALGPTFPTAVEFKRLYSDAIPTSSNPTLTFSVAYNPAGIVFTSPTQTQYTNWQFVPISTIPVVASNVAFPNSFFYYYAAGLPRGLTLNLDPSGIEASITGTSSQFDDTSRRVVLYAALDPDAGGGVAALPIFMRTILPTVQKHQTSAGAWTSLVRQYTVVNAAQNSVNGKALPSTEPPLGEFTRPEPPDSVSATGDANCVKRC